jgi:tight junction protein 1
VEEDEDEDGHTVVATARGIFNSNGGVLSSIETGVSIIIPQGAIPEGIEQEIYFKVCRDNSILPPLDKEKGKCAYCLLHCNNSSVALSVPVYGGQPQGEAESLPGWFRLSTAFSLYN